MKITNEMQAAFIDEMEKISSVKMSGILQNLGNTIKHTTSDIGGALNTMVAHPVQGMGAGLKVTGQQLRDSVGQMKTGPWGAIKGGLLPGMMALGLYSGVKGLRGAEDPTGMGRGRGERVGDFIGSQFGGLVGASHGIGGNIVAGMAGQKAGATVGRVIDKIRGYTPPEDADRRVSTRAYNTFSPVPRARRMNEAAAARAAPAVQAPAPSMAGGQTA